MMTVTRAGQTDRVCGPTKFEADLNWEQSADFRRIFASAASAPISGIKDLSIKLLHDFH
jgi:glucose-6-phosphate dehydrogenase assembly protein OpcA